jgi:dTDP-4-amino-4,6-dideoxygalactose transaminase
VHFQALHLHSFYTGDRLRRGMFPVAEMVSDRTLSLPFSAGMSDDDGRSCGSALWALSQKAPHDR